jgi:uncharacterized alkaline shock family protein YloU
VPDDPTPGRALVTRRAIAEIVRTAVLGSYGVVGFVAGPFERLMGRAGLAQPGLHVSIAHERIAVVLDLEISYGLPVAEVARQVEAAVRYRVHAALGRDVDRLTIRVDGLACPPGRVPRAAEHEAPGTIHTSDLADSGSDVA